ncbi:MAG: hypothetical protein H0X29_04985 [Parachlamydiaceae bacterium]|nr:hypothetical protein [Parachlamydiaceae bacterium]
MSFHDSYPLAKFGIDEIYIHQGLSQSLIDKLYQRSLFSLDAEDAVIKKYASHDMVLIFNKTIPNRSLIHRFFKFIEEDTNKDGFIKSNILINEDELFLAIKSKKFVLVTYRIVVKETYSPSVN